MPDSTQWLVFLGACAVFALVPGPGILYVLARSLRGGRTAGLYSVLGNSIGALTHVVAAALGLSAVLAASATAFTVVKLAGAAYLIYLGIRALLDRDTSVRAVLADVEPVRRSWRGLVGQGALTELLNPKTALFFLAFLPHFVQQGTTHPILVFALLGAIAVATATAVDVLVAFGAGRIGEALGRRPHWQRRQRLTTGLTMIGLGGALALAEQG
ncbi:LysE family translocator [Labedaea rhizosphaerae]|uniref:Threonine/homoserine/homoserine lactone efflux protein n=1 Tax=Labedaea rhizosphaerae TaxID=598644 RepID=A0A4R6RYU7_LABRH|nr:LysE family translocator [Labedaea rhizosphaerae]TDP92064.1 threonine/homoserine/homoserine lactone efflux protein [Labedaea rhizosphaerae]